MENQPFTNSTPFTGIYAPPTNCPQPWTLIVLDWNGTVGNIQYDRAGALWLDRVEILRTTTPEPTGPKITWSTQKNVSEYASLFSQPRQVKSVVTNSLNADNQGIIYVTAVLTFYVADSHDLPIPAIYQIFSVATNTSAPWFSLTPSEPEGRAILRLPTSIVSASLEVYATGHGCDEFWYLDNDCGVGPQNVYREIHLMLDGNLVGAVTPLPLIYTGFTPDLWKPIPPVDAFNVPPYALDFTPFAGILSDGNQHKITILVTNNRHSWLVDANLLLLQDIGSQSTAGDLMSGFQPNPTVRTTRSSDLTGLNSFAVTTEGEDSYNFTGYSDTSMGRITTTVQRNMTFIDVQEWRVLSMLVYLTFDSTVSTKITKIDGRGTTTFATVDRAHLIIRLSSGCPLRSVLPISVDQSVMRATIVNTSGGTLSTGSIYDDVSAVDGGLTTEQYIVTNGGTTSFSHYILASGGRVMRESLAP